jgi:putative sterol carrier protein
MDVETPREFFEKVLPKRFDPNKAVGVDVIVQVNIDGPCGGEWIVTIKHEKIQVTEGTHSSPVLFVKMKEKDFLDVINDKISGQKAFLTGRLQFKGSLSLALKLKEIGFL